MHYLKKILLVLLYAILSIIALVMLYFIVAFILTVIPVNFNYTPRKQGIEIFVTSNGAHTDICLPVKTLQTDWSQMLPECSNYQYIGLGWGDRKFYLETPTWADVKPCTALEAAFLPTPSLMCVSTYIRKPVCDKLTRSLFVDEKQYNQIVTYIKNSFQYNRVGKLVPIPNNEGYYEAQGYYTLFKTCNNWTNIALKEAGIKTAIWAPFDWGVLFWRD